jgi:hypothetical protein
VPANLFLDAVGIGEKLENHQQWRLFHTQAWDSPPKSSKDKAHPTQKSSTTQCGAISANAQGLVQFEDTKLVRMKPMKGSDNVFWETSMESVIQDHK